MLEQIAAFIGKKNMYPAPKIFANAIKLHKAYEKHMKDIGLAEIVLQAIRSKESKGTKQLESAIKKSDNEFGFNLCQYA